MATLYLGEFEQVVLLAVLRLGDGAYAIPIRNHLGADGAVLDIFAGTGPAFSAAEQLDRICYGIELSPGYCDVIVQRWEKLSGKGATRESGARRAQTTQG